MHAINSLLKPHSLLAGSAALTLGLCLAHTDASLNGFRAATEPAAATASGFLWTLIGINLGALALAGIAWIANSRQNARRVQTTVAAIRRLADGNLEAPVDGGPADRVLASLSMLRDRLLEERAGAASAYEEIPCLEQAIQNLHVGVMVTDEQQKIAFINDHLRDMFRECEMEIEREIPGFSADRLLGQEIHTLCTESASQPLLMRPVTEHGQLEHSLGKRRYRLHLDAIRDEDNRVTGSVITWDDITVDYAFEAEIQEIVSGANHGDLSRRIDATHQRGPRQNLASGINDLMSVSEAVIDDTVRVLSALASGRLDETIDTTYEGAFDRLKQDANSTVKRLREVVANIQQSSDSVSTAFSEISEGNLNLSQRTEQQAASLEEAACSMEQMTSTVQQNAENAQRAYDVAVKARKQAQNGGQVVGDAVTAMTEINAASEKIADIIGVINDITFQTNLLALNASVEAARAGEQGRGFAVVAGEVRNLAGRSAVAAKEIKSLIQDSVAKIGKGSALVNQSGKTLDTIVAGVKEVTDIVAEISAASVEQSSGISEVNMTIAQMDNMTQQNAALVEEVAAASELASEQARNLTTLISFFSADGARLGGLELPVQSSMERRAVERPWAARQAPESSMPASAPIDARPPMPTTATLAKAPAAGSKFSEDWEEF